MSEHTPTRFTIIYRDGRYFISIPNYQGGEVVAASVADVLVKALEDAVETMESMDLHVGNPLYERLTAALARVVGSSGERS